jgi:glucose-1-phosphate adenylyltransferase
VDPAEAAGRFGVVETDASARVIGFQEKPEQPRRSATNLEKCNASMGIYIFNTQLLIPILLEDAERADSTHDFGKDILPRIIDRFRVFAYNFIDENKKEALYWRDVGTLDAYYQANMDLIAVDPVLNLYDREWPIRTWQPQLPPPKFVFQEERPGDQTRRGEAHDSMVCQGCIVSGGHVRRSILSPNVRVNSYAVVEDSILFEGVDVGRHSRIRRAIIDKDVKIPPHSTIGYDLEHDRQRGFGITEQGVVVIAKAELPETIAQQATRLTG